LVAYATIIAAPDLDAADLANVEVMLQRSFDQVDRAICQLSQSAAPPTPALPSWPTLTTSRWRSSTILTLRSLRATLDAATVLAGLALNMPGCWSCSGRLGLAHSRVAHFGVGPRLFG
jgi:hypothetical protein